MAETHHVVVDGSNLATEGRTSPSLAQLDEAVQAYAAEDPGAEIVVVVDATFEHRVSDAERDAVRQAMLNGEVVSPPAGAIGRGDAFVLRIAERTGAVVLSNDSFQEFHGEHPWLFDDGRLIGGKPVPGVGWIFTPRLPIRGPKSRAATAEVKSKKDPGSAASKAAELARAAKKAAKRTKSAKKSTPPVDTSWPIAPTTPPPGRGKVDPLVTSAIHDAVEEALHPQEPKKPKGATKKPAAAKKEAPPKHAKAKKEETAPKKPATQPQTSGRSKHKKGGATPPPAVNEPLSFINFVAAYTVGSTIQGEVVSFTSHGAMVDVSLPAGGVLHCYIPLSAMGSPPPTKARQVLKKGEVRSFVLAGLDPPRRVAELALPPPPAAKGGTRTKKATAQKKSPPAKKAAPPAKKAAAPAKKAAAGGKKAAPAKKAAAKKAAPAKKVAAKKATPAKKAPAPAKKSTAPAERSTGRRARGGR